MKYYYSTFLNTFNYPSGFFLKNADNQNYIFLDFNNFGQKCSTYKKNIQS